MAELVHKITGQGQTTREPGKWDFSKNAMEFWAFIPSIDIAVEYEGKFCLEGERVLADKLVQ